MKKSTAVLSSGLFSMVVVGALAGTAISGVNGPGFAFKAASPGDNACLQVYSYGGIINNCATPRLIVATLPITSAGWHPTSVNVKGVSSWCQSVSTGGNANASQVGSATYTTAEPDTWKTLDTGDRYVWASSALTFRCSLEAGGIIGLISAQ